MLYYNNVPFALDRYEISENQSLANAGSSLKYNYSVLCGTFWLSCNVLGYKRKLVLWAK